MTSKTAAVAVTLAASLGAALALASAAKAGPAPAQPGADKCYGVSMVGKNDCAAGACAKRAKRLSGLSSRRPD